MRHQRSKRPNPAIPENRGLQPLQATLLEPGNSLFPPMCNGGSSDILITPLTSRKTVSRFLGINGAILFPSPVKLALHRSQLASHSARPRGLVLQDFYRIAMGSQVGSMLRRASKYEQKKRSSDSRLSPVTYLRLSVVRSEITYPVDNNIMCDVLPRVLSCCRSSHPLQSAAQSICMQVNFPLRACHLMLIKDLALDDASQGAAQSSGMHGKTHLRWNCSIRRL